MRIVLFDIDGTLVWTHGAGRRAMERALQQELGHPGPAEHRYDGKTDKQIVREAMRLTGHDDAEIDARMGAVIARYLEALALDLDRDDHGAVALPGVTELLDAVDDDPSLMLGLLTGNVVAGAERKLRAVGIAPERFVVGAFGTDHEHRHELPPIARDRAAARLGRAVEGAACVIIGDTPMDIACGRPIGARAIAVATGHYDVPALSAHAPDAVFADLRDTAAVLEAIRAA